MRNLAKKLGSQDYANRFMDASSKILSGAKFNGTVYSKRVSTKNFDLSIYVDGNYISLGRYFRDEVEDVKKVFLSLVEEASSSDKTTTPETSWIVNDKVVKNNLNYNQMVDKYGMCNFE